MFFSYRNYYPSHCCSKNDICLTNSADHTKYYLIIDTVKHNVNYFCIGDHFISHGHKTFKKDQYKIVSMFSIVKKPVE